MSDTIVQLGDFQFAHAEVPQGLPFGGDQELSINKFVGGKRTINAMGNDEDDITWRGIFFGAEALKRAQFLNYLKTQGNKHVFTYFNFKYSVIIKHFSGTVQKYYQIPYSITLTVIEDLTNPVTIPPPAGFLDALFDDLATLYDIYPLVSDPAIGVALIELSAYMDTLLPNTALTASVRATLDGHIRDVNAEVQKGISSLAGVL